jgi:hypothetical protein
MEQALMQPGKAFMMESVRHEDVNNLLVGLLRLTNLDSSEKYTAIAFTYSLVFGNPIFTTHAVHIDTEELNDVINAVSRFSYIIKNKRTANNEVYRFTTSNLIVFRLENRSNNFELWDLSIYKRYKNLDGKVAGTEIFLKGKFLDEFLRGFDRNERFHKKISPLNYQ